MREIKFRAWDKNRNVMRIFGNKDYMQGFGMDGFFIPLENGNCIPMQFTGLLDKNGKEVYEHDIILFPNEVTEAPQEVLNGAPEGRPWYLRTRNARGWWGDPKSWKDVEIIGNVHENPELLK